MEKIQIKASPRSILGKQVKVLRRQGKLPAVVYGAGIEPIPLELDARDAARVMAQVGSSTLIDLEVDGKTYKALVREVQRDVITKEMIHLDFLNVAMDVKIKTVVPVELVGEAPAVRDLGGVLVTGLSEIEVEALPSDLPDRITVDLEALQDFNDSITVGDLYLGEGVTVLTDPDEAIANVVYQTMEEEIVEVEEELVAEVEPEVVERGAREEDESSEASEPEV
ncbi:MAG TPA: 50S ribosomal protein L25 [Chloroflexi bacterium]|nr:50S ribosomal protein L25 [Chloroflexota bacterium]